MPHRAGRRAKLAVSRLTEVTCTAVPAGTDAGVAYAGRIWQGSGHAWLLAPIELRSVAPDAVKNDSHLSGDGDLRFLQADALDEAEAPGLQRRPSLGAVDEYGRRLEQVRSQEPVAPSGDAPRQVELSGLLSPRRQPEISADAGSRPEAGGIVDGVAERERRDVRQQLSDSEAGALVLCDEDDRGRG